MGCCEVATSDDVIHDVQPGVEVERQDGDRRGEDDNRRRLDNLCP